MNSFSRRSMLALAAAAACAPQVALSANWPQGTVKLIVPYPPGSSNDAFARLLADFLQKKYGQSFIVENKPGASGRIGIKVGANSKPDGLTFLVVSSSIVTNLTVPSDIKYDVINDFEPVSMAAALPVIMVVRKDLPVNNAAEFIALAKKDPGALKFGTSGVGSPHQLTTELFQAMTGTKMLTIPYQGQNPILTDLLGGRLDFAFVTLGPTLPFVRDGRFKSIGMIGSARTSLAPDIPTLQEQGIKGMDTSWWLGAFAPKGTDPAIVSELSNEIVRLTKDAQFKERLAGVGIDPVGTSSNEFISLIKRETATWDEIAKKAGITK